MPFLFGREFDVQSIRRHVGNMDQLASVQVAESSSGLARPSRVAIIREASGLEYTVLLDRGMDIGSASYRGVPMGWRAPAGDVAPYYFEPEGRRWLRTWQGGLVATCGLQNVGAPAQDSHISARGLHGRIGSLPAENLRVQQEWIGDDYVLSVTGTLRESSVFEENLTLTRRVETRLGDPRISIRDVITNEGFQSTPFQLLYHCNIGWPAVAEGSRVLIPSALVAPRDEVAAAGLPQWADCAAPTNAYQEQTSYHKTVPDAHGVVTAAIANRELLEEKEPGFGVYVRWRKDQLPNLIQWKQMGEQIYVVGMEPSNCSVQGREHDEEHGLIRVLEPGETLEVHLELGPLTTSEALEPIASTVQSVDTRQGTNYLDCLEHP